MEPSKDERTFKQVYRDWECLLRVKREMVKSGILNADATPDQVIQRMREVVRPELFGAK